MDWRLKCLALHVLQHAPRAWHASLQRRITGRYFLTLTDAIFTAYHYHVQNFAGGRVLEFGAGSNLVCALMLSAAGATEVLAYDLSRIATVEQINHVIRQLRTRMPGEWPPIGNLDDLKRLYRVHYLAPADARETGLPPGSVDFVCSTSTLEHIPVADIERILAECCRAAAAGAHFSFIIDYHDHYTSVDTSITRTNFYRYSDAVWRWFNPPNHYQNRLRHSDYERIFAAHGLHAVEQRRVMTPTTLDWERMHPRFRTYKECDLAALNGYFHYTT